MTEFVGLRPEVEYAFFSRFPDLTATQKESIPPILRGEDTLVVSGTGSGKTEAVLAPLISRNYDSAKVSHNIQIIYVAPTKALVNDIAKRISPVLELLELGVSVRHGDNNQLRQKKKHTVLITTPESLEVLLATNPAIFAEVKSLVIDEAHLLFNQQRGFQLAVEVHRIEQLLGRKLQVVAASATISSPESLWKFFRPNNDFALAHQTNHREMRSQIRIGYNHEQLIKLLAKLPKDQPIKILIFGDTKRECDAIALKLQESPVIDHKVFSHHASLSPEIRLKVEKGFSEESQAICVATSTLELGIDIGDINLVILWGKARNWQSFMQRIGRGNRRSTFVEVICILPSGNIQNFSELFGFQSLLEQVRNGKFPKQGPFELYGVICQQICILLSAKDSGFIGFSTLVNIFTPFSFIDPADLKELLLSMSEEGLIIKDPNRMAFGPSEKIHDLRDKNLLWSNIPHSNSTVPLMLGNLGLGNLNSGNLFKLNLGSVFAFATKRLKVVSLNNEEVRVVETGEAINSRIKFGGTGQSLEVSLLSALRDYLANKGFREKQDIFPGRLFDLYAKELERLFIDCDLDNRIPYFVHDSKYHYLTFGGLVLNSTLSLYLDDPGDRTNDLMLVSSKEIDFSSLPSRIEDYIEIVRNLDLIVGGKSEFQDYLTPKLKSLESISKWKSEVYYSETLSRLISAQPFEIQTTDVFTWA